MNHAATRAALAEAGSRPTKSLGQNFLHDEEVAQWIVDQLQIQPGDHLIEVGPGLGALSEWAVPKAASATLVEKDGRLVEYLRAQFEDEPKVEIRHEDALTYDIRQLFPYGPVKVLGNLPYYVSSQLLLTLTSDPSPASRMVFTLQKEMAERLSAQPSTKEYGALTLIIGRRWKVDYVRTLPGSVFYPAPNVESGVVVLSPRDPEEYPDCDPRLFNRLVKEGFSQRRKMLRKMLAHHDLDWPALCAALGIEETVRGEALSLGQWIDLARYVENIRHPGILDVIAQDVHGEMFDVVDEENNVVGQLSRHEVHRQRLNHRAIHLFVVNKRGDLFLQKRSRHKDVHPGRWDSSCAGHLTAGQDYEEAASRELMEELGVEAPLKLISSLPASRATGYEFVRLYQVEHNGPFTWPRAEIETGAFFPVSLLEEWIRRRPEDFAYAFQECFHLWRELTS